MESIYVNVIAVWVAAGFVGALIAMRALFRRWKSPYISTSVFAALQSDRPSLRQRLAFLPRALFWVALFFFVFAFIDPHTYVRRDRDAEGELSPKGIPTEGIAIYLVLDTSKSMLESLATTTASGRRREVTKMDLLKDVTKRFVKGDQAFGLRGRDNDLLGIVTFARSAQVVSPLTLDHEEILQKLNALEANRDESQLGTALGYAIFKTANLIAATRHFGNEEVTDGKPAYDIESSVILLVTDGFQEINPEDLNNPLRSIDLVEAVEYAEKQKVKLYIVNIDPKITSERFADNRKFFRLLTERTGGKFFFVDSPNDLAMIYSEIDQLEKSVLPSHTGSDKENLPHLYQRLSLYPWLIAAGMISLFLAIVLQTTVLRRVP